MNFVGNLVLFSLHFPNCITYSSIHGRLGVKEEVGSNMEKMLCLWYSRNSLWLAMSGTNDNVPSPRIITEKKWVQWTLLMPYTKVNRQWHKYQCNNWEGLMYIEPSNASYYTMVVISKYVTDRSFVWLTSQLTMKLMGKFKT